MHPIPSHLVPKRVHPTHPQYYPAAIGHLTERDTPPLARDDTGTADVCVPQQYEHPAPSAAPPPPPRSGVSRGTQFRGHGRGGHRKSTLADPKMHHHPQPGVSGLNTKIIAEDADSVMDFDTDLTLDSDDGDSSGCEEPESLTHIDEAWTCDGELAGIPFEGTPGLMKFPNGGDPYDFFQLMLDQNFIVAIVNETNKHARRKFEADVYEDVTPAEFTMFIGLLLHSGNVKCHDIRNYWDEGRLFGLDNFSRHMPWRRFEYILRALHFSSDRSMPLGKVLPVVDYFNHKMAEVYYPSRELSVVRWKERFVIREYVAGCEHKREVKLCGLRDGSGMTVRVKLGGLVSHLLDNFLHKGHSVYIENTTFDMVQNLLASKTYCTGTLRGQVIKAELLKHQVISLYKNNIVIGKFKDRRDASFISSEYKAGLTQSECKRKIWKPLALHQHDRFMCGMRRTDQILARYSSSRRAFKWYVNVWLNLVETLLLNSFHLYSTYSPSLIKLNYHEYRLNVIDILLFGKSRENSLGAPEHSPEMLPRGKGNKIRRKNCRQCYRHGIRKATNYYCPACECNPGFCLGKCFKDYHKQKK